MIAHGSLLSFQTNYSSRLNVLTAIEGYVLKHLMTAIEIEHPSILFMEDEYIQRAVDFIGGFPGMTIYAVKANPHPYVIEALLKAGINGFDVASIKEIQIIHRLAPDARMYFNHPIKTIGEIKESYLKFGVKDFVVDTDREFKKIIETIGPGFTCQIRLRVQDQDAVFPLSEKFGTTTEHASKLIEMCKGASVPVSFCFHPGTFNKNLSIYANAFSSIDWLCNHHNITPVYVNVGGGFPSTTFEDLAKPMGEYFEAIRTARCSSANLRDVELLCEPGTALAAPGTYLVANVTDRRDKTLYIDDGIYGGLSELKFYKICPFVSCVSLQKKSLHKSNFRIYGPTCDALDVLPIEFSLPEDVAVGDKLIFRGMGAYSLALMCDFNGKATHVAERLNYSDNKLKSLEKQEIWGKLRCL